MARLRRGAVSPKEHVLASMQAGRYHCGYVKSDARMRREGRSKCIVCGDWVRLGGLHDHVRAKHRAFEKQAEIARKGWVEFKQEILNWWRNLSENDKRKIFSQFGDDWMFFHDVRYDDRWIVETWEKVNCGS